MALYRVSCDPTCGFLMEDHDKEEILELSVAHANRTHAGMKLTVADIRKMIVTL